MTHLSGFLKWFGIMLFCVLLLGIAREYHRASTASRRQFASVRDAIFRRVPHRAVPTLNLREEITEQTINTLVKNCKPKSVKFGLLVGVAEHSFRIWGNAKIRKLYSIESGTDGIYTTFSDDDVLRFLFDDRYFRKCYPGMKSLLYRSEYGVGVRASANPHPAEIPSTRWPDYAAHLDVLLADCGELGYGMDFPVFVGDEKLTLADLLSDSINRYTSTQERDFTLLAYLYYLDGEKRWTNRYGHHFTLEQEIVNLLNNGTAKGACAGTHRAQLIAAALAMDTLEPFLTQSSRRLLEDELITIAKKLEAFQSDDGAYLLSVTGGDASAELLTIEGQLMAELRATGHHLEWMAITEPRLRASDRSIERALRFLETELSELPAESYYANYTNLTHCVRAILLCARPELF